jgi:hypothetical protein
LLSGQPTLLIFLFHEYRESMYTFHSGMGKFDSRSESVRSHFCGGNGVRLPMAALSRRELMLLFSKVPVRGEKIHPKEYQDFAGENKRRTGFL